MKKTIIAIVLLLLSVLRIALGVWGALDSLITKLRGQGEFGKFMASILESPITALLLAIVGLAVAWAAWMEHRKRNTTNGSQDKAGKAGKETRSLTQTMIGSPNAMQAGQDIDITTEVKRDQKT